MPGASTVGFDRARLEHLRRATDDAIATAGTVRLDDRHAADAVTTVRATHDFLVGPWRHAIVSTLATWQLEREIAGKVGTAVGRLVGVHEAGAPGSSCQLRFAHLTFGDLLTELLDRLVADHGHHSLVGDFWTRYGNVALDELHARLLADPRLINHLTEMPAMIPLLGLLIPRRDLQNDVRLAIALAVTSTPAFGALADSALHEHSVAVASGIVFLTGEQPIESVSDLDLLLAVLRSGSGDPELLGNWVGTTVDDLRERGWPADESVGLLAGLTQLAGLGRLSETDAPPALLIPTAEAGTPLLIAGGFGGAAEILARALHGDLDRLTLNALRPLFRNGELSASPTSPTLEEMLRRFRSIGELRNGLTDGENRELLRTSDPHTVTSLVVRSVHRVTGRR